jgi:hypothetical protein
MTPVTGKHGATAHFFPRKERNAERNAAIRRLYATGQFKSLAEIGEQYQMTAARVHQIVFGRTYRVFRPQGSWGGAGK